MGAYIKYEPYIYNGTTWVKYQPYIYNGNSWVNYNIYIYSDSVSSALHENRIEIKDIEYLSEKEKE